MRPSVGLFFKTFLSYTVGQAHFTIRTGIEYDISNLTYVLCDWTIFRFW